MGKRILSAYLRIDARSLGLFRIAMALVLLGDLFRRWSVLRVFYSNEGVLPNHNHLFNLRDKGQIWSFLHAFSSPGENHFAFALILFVYVCFLLGWHTRIFHALALLCLVSLGSRNILLENQGNYAAVALVFFTLFLPLGSRFSIDSLRASLARREEKTPSELNEAKRATEAEIEASRGPGFSPLSFAALAVVLQIGLILAASAAWHFPGPWRSGEGLFYTLHVERWVSDLGAHLANAPPGLLKGLSYLLFATEIVVPVLVLVPVGRRITRGISAGLLAFYGLSLGLFFSLAFMGFPSPQPRSCSSRRRAGKPSKNVSLPPVPVRSSTTSIAAFACGRRGSASASTRTITSRSRATTTSRPSRGASRTARSSAWICLLP